MCIHCQSHKTQVLKMSKTQNQSLPILLGSACLLFGLTASAQVYNESTRQLTLPNVQVGTVAFPNVVIRLDNFTVLGAGAPVTTPPTGLTPQTYNESTRQLTMGNVQAGTVWFPNVVVRLDSFAVLAAGAPVPSAPVPGVATGSGSCAANPALYTVGNNYEVELAGTASSGAASGNVRYGIKSTVTQNTTFKGQAAVETRLETTYVETLAGLPAAGITATVFTYGAVQGSEVLNFGAKIKTAAEGFVVNNTISFSPATLNPLSWTAGQRFTDTVTVTTEFTGLPVVVPATTAQQTLNVRFVGRESVTVPAGTFDACRFETTENGETVTSWSVATGRYAGLFLKGQNSNGRDVIQATRLRFNGS